MAVEGRIVLGKWIFESKWDFDGRIKSLWTRLFSSLTWAG
jgi:hypothetical protein